MKKIALMTALAVSSAIAMPAMADNGHHYGNQGMPHDASAHKYIKYNNGNAYGKHKVKHKVKHKKATPKKYAKKYYTVKTTTYKPVTHRVVIHR